MSNFVLPFPFCGSCWPVVCFPLVILILFTSAHSYC